MFRVCAAFLFFLLLGFFCGNTGNASVITTDSIYISTIGGQGISNGLTFSSYVYMTSGSSLTLQGAGGYITTSSSVTASSFFGDGSHLTGVGDAILTSTQTFSGANTFTSSFTVQSGGQQIILSTSTTANNISISSTGSISFYHPLHNSSSTIIPGTQTTNAKLGPCISGSTLTIVTTGGNVEAEFSAFMSLDGGAASSGTAVGILQDGNFIRDMTGTKGVAYARIGDTDQVTTTFSYLIDAPSSGSHSYCITIAAPDSTGEAVHLYNDSVVSKNIFFIKELK